MIATAWVGDNDPVQRPQDLKAYNIDGRPYPGTSKVMTEVQRKTSTLADAHMELTGVNHAFKHPGWKVFRAPLLQPRLPQLAETLQHWHFFGARFAIQSEHFRFEGGLVSIFREKREPCRCRPQTEHVCPSNIFFAAVAFVSFRSFTAFMESAPLVKNHFPRRKLFRCCLPIEIEGGPKERWNRKAHVPTAITDKGFSRSCNAETKWSLQ